MNESSPTTVKPDVLQAARKADLHYTSDNEPGIRRSRTRIGFRYTSPTGRKLSRDDHERIRKLAIPPAWTDVWICADEDGHLQATGRDAKGRKQARYHARWREVRDGAKYERLSAFGKVLPRLRRRIKNDLAATGLPRQKVLAALIQLLEVTHIRIGNVEYARQNGSIGLTTMRDKHVAITGETLRFEFTGKSGVKHDVGLRDKRLARIVKKCQDLPGQTLFQYLDADGQKHAITSADVNDYLREVTGEAFTAKDFRTWTGTVLAYQLLNEIEVLPDMTSPDKSINQVIAQVAAELGNTKAVCRKFYIHPAVIDAYVRRCAGNGDPVSAKRCRTRLHASEHALMLLLKNKRRKAS